MDKPTHRNVCTKCSLPCGVSSVLPSQLTAVGKDYPLGNVSLCCGAPVVVKAAP